MITSIANELIKEAAPVASLAKVFKGLRTPKPVAVPDVTKAKIIGPKVPTPKVTPVQAPKPPEPPKVDAVRKMLPAKNDISAYDVYSRYPYA